MQRKFPLVEKLQMSLSSVGLRVSFSLLHELHSYSATPDDNANFLAKDVLFYSKVGFLSNPRGLWDTSGKSFQYI